MFSLEKKPEIDGMFWFKAGLFGFGFFGFVNTKSRIGPINIDIKPYYTNLTKIPMFWILQDEAGRTAEFWQDCNEELTNKPAVNIERGLAFLEEYINTGKAFNNSMIDDPNNYTQLEAYQTLLDSAKRKRKPQEKAKAIINLFKQAVRTSDLRRGLTVFDCQETLKKYQKDLRS